MNRRFEKLSLSQKLTAVMVSLVMIPVLVLAIVWTTASERTEINSAAQRLRHTMERSGDQVSSSVRAVNMATQFFLSDEALTEVLSAAVSNRTFTTEELLDYYETDVASLERLVNSNTLLYGVRVYSVTDSLQEMMPVLYKKSRMERQPWGQAGLMQGWYFDYTDALFSGRGGEKNIRLCAYLTPVSENGETIGVIETVLRFEDLVPAFFEESGIGFFLAEDGTVIEGSGAVDAQAVLAASSVFEESIVRSGNLLVAVEPRSDLNGRLVYVTDLSSVIRRSGRWLLVIIGVLAALSVLLSLAIQGLVRHMLRQLTAIETFIGGVQAGDLDSRLPDPGRDEMGILAGQINAMLDRIAELSAENLKREMLAKNSQIRALQNQINAHFIYNVLETIKMMAEIDEEYEISDALTGLGQMLRYSLHWTGGLVTVGEELAYIESYIALMNLRCDYPIHLDVKVPDEVRCQEMPKMTLQPLVENAVLHGVEPLAQETTITIKGYIQEEACRIEVTDMGLGMSEEQLDSLRSHLDGALEADGAKEHGIALKNVQDRLVMAFGRAYGLSFSSKEKCFTKVSVTIPKTDRTAVGPKELEEKK